MRDKRRIQLIKEFIENPSVKRAEAMLCNKEEALNILLCLELADWNECCEKCVWQPICRYGKSANQVTDEEMSSMVLDATRALAIYEAEHV